MINFFKTKYKIVKIPTYSAYSGKINYYYAIHMKRWWELTWQDENSLPVYFAKLPMSFDTYEVAQEYLEGYLQDSSVVYT